MPLTDNPFKNKDFPLIRSPLNDSPLNKNLDRKEGNSPPPGSSFMVTEDGDFMVTESGDFMITEPD